MEILLIIILVLIVYNVVYNIPYRIKEHDEKEALKFKELYIRINRLEKMLEDIGYDYKDIEK
ncbi:MULTISPECIES: hypothetical protein [Clostridium]|uniref:Phage protein n=1 Tax=Clostridium nitritogenes TaxID=83340 RepID=A0ABN1LN24_9CLOT|nr:hypothetical protein [Clostridium baratii]MDU1053259.1 hypothetical protein [Clostridium baratii]MDU1854941.1 hypothetical protein [Clostridium baratii]MDU4911215.1 hypothetical protein [Clostridium baratii]MDY3206059.1 hypothetical protein [Clostridium baratii]CUP10374.1 Uncharacterised protein [Clostridium baratii]